MEIIKVKKRFRTKTFKAQGYQFTQVGLEIIDDKGHLHIFAHGTWKKIYFKNYLKWKMENEKAESESKKNEQKMKLVQGGKK